MHTLKKQSKTYAYVRVSTNKQNLSNQTFEINRYAKERGIRVDCWIREVVSGGKKASERKLGRILRRMRRDDTLVVSEVSRLGRSLLDVMSVLGACVERGVRVVAIKEKISISDDLQSKVLAFAFSLAGEVERALLSARTREALARKKAEGAKLGRPRGAFLRLKGKERLVAERLARGDAKAAVARSLNVSRSTLYNFLRRR